MHPFERLTAWRKAHAFTLAALVTLARVQRSPYHDLVGQLRRCSVSVSARIAEGSGRASAAQFFTHLSAALGSAREARYLIRLCADVGVLSLAERAQLEARCDLVCRLLIPLMRHVRRGAAGHSARRVPPGAPQSASDQPTRSFD